MDCFKTRDSRDGQARRTASHIVAVYRDGEGHSNLQVLPGLEITGRGIPFVVGFPQRSDFVVVLGFPCLSRSFSVLLQEETV